MRFATLLLGPRDQPLELTVTKLGRQGDDKLEEGVLQNVNRWRGQMGVAPVEANQLKEVAVKREVNGVTSYRVDMVGPRSGKTSRGPMMGARGARPPRPEAPPAGNEPKGGEPRYDLPRGWEPARPDAFSLQAFTVSDGGQTARITVTPLGPDPGSLVANINRWRQQQLHLPPVTPEQALALVHKMQVGGVEAVYFDDAGKGPAAQRMLVVILPQGDRTWFFKMLGPADLVGRQKDAFEAFVKSVRFD
jgi:hypothetical protein